MFYYETQYLDPVSAVTLMSRYCEPANTGLLMLLVTLSSGVMPGAALRRVSGKRQWLLGGMAAVILLSCTGYREAWRRFVYDELDASRIEKRLTFLDTYRDFIDATAVVPYQESGSRYCWWWSPPRQTPLLSTRCPRCPLSMSGWTREGKRTIPDWWRNWRNTTAAISI